MFFPQLEAQQLVTVEVEIPSFSVMLYNYVLHVLRKLTHTLMSEVLIVRERSEISFSTFSSNSDPQFA